MPDSEVKSLSRFGEKFQVKTIACLMNDKTFMEQMRDILFAEYYDTEALRWICEAVLSYWDEYRSPPTTDYFKTRLHRSEISDALKASVVNDLKYIIRAREDSDLEWVKDDFLEFAQNQRIRQAIMQSTSLLKQGNYTAIKTEIDDALNAGLSRDLGHMYKEDFEDRLTDSARPAISTGFPVIDDLMDGGLAGGEVGVFVAPSGAGKCVGADTEISVQYEQIGVPAGDGTVWLDPWDAVDVSSPSMNDAGALVAAHRMQAVVGASTETRERTVAATTTMDALFDDVGVGDASAAHEEPEYDIRVLTPAGYRSVSSLFRTAPQRALDMGFSDGTELRCSRDHRLMSDGRWTHASELERGALVETAEGEAVVEHATEIVGRRVLYDLEVEEEHCYYTNGLLSHNSWMLAALGYACAVDGGLVAHYTLELDDKYTGRRYDSIAGGFSPNEVPEHAQDITRRMKDLEGEVSIRKWPAKSVTVQSVHAHFERLSTLKRRPSLIVLDYADLLRSANSASDANSYHVMGDIYTALRRLGGELDVPIWTVSQTNREGAESEVITADMIADSFQKVMISDFVASISRTADDKVSNMARIHLIKNRFGPDGMTLPAMIDTSCGRIEVYELGSDKARQNARDAKLKAQKKEDRLIGDLYDQFKRTGSVSKNDGSSF